MTGENVAMPSRAPKGKGAATKKQLRARARRVLQQAQQERERRIDNAEQHRSSGQR